MGYEDVLRNLKVKDELYVGGSISGTGLVNTAGNVWYVNSNLSGSGSGHSWDSAFRTLAEAVTAAEDYDTILVAPDTIQTIATGGITITQNGLKILGWNGSEMRQAAALKISAGTSPMFTVTGDRFEIAGFNLSCRIAYPCICIGSVTLGVGTGVYSTWIHDINFDGYGSSTFAVAMGGAGGFGVATQCDAVNTVIENCYFASHATAAVVVSGTRMTVRNNQFNVPVDTIGISVVETGSDRGYWSIIGNKFAGIANASTTAIKFAGNTTAGQGTVMNNLLCGSWDVTITANSGDIGCLNYQGSTTGGSLIDFNSSA